MVRDEVQAAPPSLMSVLAAIDQVAAVQSGPTRTASPKAPRDAKVCLPSDALAALAAAAEAYTSRYLGLASWR